LAPSVEVVPGIVRQAVELVLAQTRVLKRGLQGIPLGDWAGSTFVKMVEPARSRVEPLCTAA
jgi:hypothetical protein